LALYNWRVLVLYIIFGKCPSINWKRILPVSDRRDIPHTDPEGDFRMSEFGQKLLELRTKQGLTVKEVCKQVGIPQSRLSELERGVRLPTSGQIERLGSFYGVDSHDFASLAQSFDKN
jgi:hypothetical protein